jgi:5-methylcytosine-specific restriction protein A
MTRRAPNQTEKTDLHDPYRVEPRKPLTNKQRLEMFVRHKGICCLCGYKINGVREMWDEHINPLWLSGDNSAENRAPAHVKCARQKTSKEATEKAKSERIAEFHFGAKRPKTIMPGSRRSKWKKKVSGEVVLRNPERDGR